jgi:hypothetical protein
MWSKRALNDEQYFRAFVVLVILKSLWNLENRNFEGLPLS